MKIMIFTKYNSTGPSSYYRNYQLIDKMSNDIYVQTQYFWGEYYFKYVLKRHGIMKKFFMSPALIFGWAKRIFTIIFMIFDYDIIKIEKDLLPGLPVFLEYYIRYILKKKIIYEFDDAVFLTNFPRNKTDKMIKVAHSIIAGNELLANYALNHNENVHIIPTGINFDLYSTYIKKKCCNPHKITIGWIGTSGGLKFVKSIEPALIKIEKEGIPFEFVLICNEDLEMSIKSKTFIKWERQSADLEMSKFDIGIMPLDDDEFSKYKCGFKIIQYMAMKIPVVASPIGVNKNIIKNGYNGFLAHTVDEWEFCLKELILDSTKRNNFAEIAFAESKNVFDTNTLSVQYEEVYRETALI